MQFLTLWLKKIQAKLPFLNFASVQILTKVHIIDISKKIKYDEIKHNPQIAVDKLLDEVERNIDYLSKFKSSSICAPAIKMLKENLVSSISQSNGFNIEDNYFEVSTITFSPFFTSNHFGSKKYIFPNLLNLTPIILFI